MYVQVTKLNIHIKQCFGHCSSLVVKQCMYCINLANEILIGLLKYHLQKFLRICLSEAIWGKLYA